MPEPKRLKLTYVDYLKLLSGQVVTQDGVDVTIGDFGRERLQQALDFVTARGTSSTPLLDPDVWSYCPICQKDWMIETRLDALHRIKAGSQELEIRTCRECQGQNPMERNTIR